MGDHSSGKMEVDVDQGRWMDVEMGDRGFSREQESLEMNNFWGGLSLIWRGV